MNAARPTSDTHDAILRQSLRCLLKEGKSWLLNDKALEFVVDALMVYEKSMSVQLADAEQDEPDMPAARPVPTDEAIAGMHPEQIKALLRTKGITPTALADELGIARSTMSQVISGKAMSARIRASIAEFIGVPVEVLWPPPKSQPVLRRSREQMLAVRQRVAA